MSTSSFREPRWPAVLAILATGVLYAALPAQLTIGPRWLPLVFVFVLGLFGYVARHAGKHKESQLLGYFSVGLVTAYLLASTALLIWGIPHHIETAGHLLRSAALIWLTNVLVFATWYWRLDAGGPHEREFRQTHTEGAFLFPQMTSEVIEMNKRLETPWLPTFVDYLFLAFSTSAAFSATDTLPLSRWAKSLMMLQAGISIAIVVLLVGRSVNIF